MATAETARLIAVLELKDLFSDKISRAERQLDKFESRSTKAGRQIGVGILRGAAIAAAGATAFAGVFAKGISAASDLNETVSKTGVVFGKNAPAVLAFGRDSASALGLSENAALAAAAQYGNLFVSLGLAQGKAASMSTAMVKLAGDLASFNNVSPEEALQAIQSGLVGETEPLRKFGINLNDATLRQEALALGLTKTTKTVLPPAIKAQAAYSLILKQSGTAQGDFARTSGGLANQIRILKANATDMLATLAAPALPQVAKIFQLINKEVKANQPEIAKLGDAVAGLFSDANIKSGADVLKGAFQTAKETAPIIAESAKATFGLVQSAVGLFRSLPPELQKLAVGAFAVNKLTGGLVTNIAGGIIDVVGKNLLQRGGTPANPLFVADVTGGAGGAVPVAGAKGAVGKLTSIASKVFLVGAAIGVFAELKGILDDQSAGNKAGEANLAGQTKQFSAGASIADLKQSLSGLDEQIAALTRGLDPTSLAFQLNIDGVRDSVLATRQSIVTAIAAAEAAGSQATVRSSERLEAQFGANGERAAMDARRVEAAENRAGLTVSQAIAHHVSALGQQFGKDIHSLRAATKPFDIAKFARAIAADVQKGSGSVAGTKGVLKDLKIKLAETHDPKLQAVLRAAIAKVQAKLPNREWVSGQLSAAKKIVNSSESSSRKIADLKIIEASLRAHGDRHAAATIAKLERQIAATKGVRTAALETRQAVKDKDLSVRVNNTINTAVSVSLRDTIKVQTTSKKIGGSYIQ